MSENAVIRKECDLIVIDSLSNVTSLHLFTFSKMSEDVIVKLLEVSLYPQKLKHARLISLISRIH